MMKSNYIEMRNNTFKKNMINFIYHKIYSENRYQIFENMKLLQL